MADGMIKFCGNGRLHPRHVWLETGQYHVCRGISAKGAQELTQERVDLNAAIEGVLQEFGGELDWLSHDLIAEAISSAVVKAGFVQKEPFEKLINTWAHHLDDGYMVTTEMSEAFDDAALYLVENTFEDEDGK